jgi:hypothetical protein
MNPKDFNLLLSFLLSMTAAGLNSAGGWLIEFFVVFLILIGSTHE